MLFARRDVTDAQLVQRVLSGQRDIFGVLVERYLPLVQAVALAQTVARKLCSARRSIPESAVGGVERRESQTDASAN